MVCQLTYSVLDNHTRIKSHLTITGRTSQCIRYQTSAFHSFYLVYKAQDCWRHMNTVCHHFHCHIINQINTFYRTFILVLFPFMESRHCIIKMSGMRISRLIGCLYILKFCLGMSYRSQHPFRCDIFTKLHGSGKFRCGIPTLDTMSFFQQRNIFFGIGIFDIFRNLSACHRHIEIMSFQMKPEHRAIRLRHHFFSSFRSCTDHGNGRRRKSRKNTGSAMLHMSFDCCLESLFGAFHKVSSTATVNMDFYTSRNNIHSFGINQFGSDNCKVTIGYFQNFIVTNKN